MTFEEIVCISCFKNINDPVCKSCYLRQFKTWLESTNIKDANKQKMLKKLKESSKESLNTTKCVLCNKESVNVCFSCFSTEAHFNLKKINPGKNTVQSFVTAFNYYPYLDN